MRENQENNAGMRKTVAKEVPAPSQKQNVTLRLPRPKIQALDRLAERMGTTRSALIQMAIAEYIEKMKPSK
jgi:metal-responsive CopG/Arc/MetJ family transcriptional regulator